jgi:outer membrane autotransporter protein
MMRNPHVRRQIFTTFALGLSIAVSVTQSGEAQTTSATPTHTLTTLRGQNLAQSKMAQSINNFCRPLQAKTTPGVSPPGQVDLVNICVGLQNNAANLIDDDVPGPTFGLPTGAQVNAALQQLNGGTELLQPTNQASLLQTTQTSRQTSVVEARLSRQREGTVLASSELPSTSVGQLAALNPQDLSGRLQLAQNQPAPEFVYTTGPLGVYATGLGQFGTRDQTPTQTAYSFNNAGFVAGTDYRFSPQLIAGLAFGYTQSNVNFDTSTLSASGQFLNQNLFEGNLYATYAFTDALYMNAIAFVGGGSSNSQRHIVIPSTNPGGPNNNPQPVDQIATGSFGSQVQGVSVSGGYTLPFGALVLTPTLRFLYQHTGVDGFNENAFSVNLRYDSSRVDTVLSALGGDAQYTLNTQFGLLYPTARFYWSHQFSPSNTTLTPSFINDASLNSAFVMPGTPTSRNYYDLGVGIALQLSRNSSVFINYDSIIGISQTTYNSFTAGVRFTF